MSQASPPTPESSPAQEHLAGLHKMSTTAGVTNQGYVAVNQTAVVAGAFALASVLSFLHPVFLLVPVVGVVLSFVAIRQVRDSFGTQTGKLLAIGAMALCIVLGGVEVGREVMAIASIREDQRQIASALSEFGSLIKDQKYDQAYALTDKTFQSRVKLLEFRKTWEAVQGARSVGTLELMEWNQVPPHFYTSAGVREAETVARCKFARSSDARFDLVLRHDEGKWRISKLNAFFPEKKRGGANDDGFNI